MFGWDALVAMFLLGSLVGAAGWRALMRRPQFAWPELDELADRLTAVERRGKMFQGRLNQIAPPRTGTGAGNGEPIEPEVTQAATGPVSSRAELLKVALARRTNARNE